MTEADAAFDRLIASLAAQGFKEKPKTEWQEAVEQVKKDWAVAWQKLLKENGLTKEELIGELVAGLIVSYMMRRAVKQGNTPKTIRWAAASISISIKFYGRRQEVLLKNLR